MEQSITIYNERNLSDCIIDSSSYDEYLDCINDWLEKHPNGASYNYPDFI